MFSGLESLPAVGAVSSLLVFSSSVFQPVPMKSSSIGAGSQPVVSLVGTAATCVGSYWEVLQH